MQDVFVPLSCPVLYIHTWPALHLFYPQIKVSMYLLTDIVIKIPKWVPHRINNSLNMVRHISQLNLNY